MVRLLNSAMMPREGNYAIRQISKDDFARLLREHAYMGNLQSYIGYPDVQRMIYGLCNVWVKLNREKTVLDDGDILLIARLRYRIDDPNKKKTEARSINPDDYEFFVCDYSER